MPPTRYIAGVPVSALGFGAMGLSSFYGATESDEERFKVLDKAYELGCRNWDTAAIYGDSEELIGKWFQRTGKRNDIYLATKLDMPNFNVSGDPDFVHKSVEQSLTRLGIDCIDLFYIHRIDRNTPIEITIGALVEAMNSGKIKAIGLSECSSNTLRRAYAVHPIAAVQIEYSPFVLDIESSEVGLLNTCRELGVVTVAYSPLGRGLLTGAYKSPDDFEAGDFRHMVPKFSRENFPKILKVVEALKDIASKYSATPGQVVLAWLLAQGDDIVPIPGTKKLKYLEENVKAGELTLTPEDVALVRKIAEEAEAIEGTRYPEALMSSTFVDTPPLE